MFYANLRQLFLILEKSLFEFPNNGNQNSAERDCIIIIIIIINPYQLCWAEL